MGALFEIVGNLTYVLLAFLALWGAYNAVLVWRRVGLVRFKTEDEQEEWLNELDALLLRKNFDGSTELCTDDRRAMPQLAMFAIENREMGLLKVQRRLWERFQQDVLADVEHRMSWVATVIKSAPMVGLFGTVLGMMGAFSNLSAGTKVDPAKMAEDIMFALITTAIGLAVAVPLIILSNSINGRLKKMEDLLSLGLTHLVETLKVVLT